MMARSRATITATLGATSMATAGSIWRNRVAGIPAACPLALTQRTDDPAESNDLAARQPQRTADLSRRLDDSRRQFAAPMPRSNPIDVSARHREQRQGLW